MINVEEIDEITICLEDLENELMGFLVTLDNKKYISCIDWNIIQSKIEEFINDLYKARKL